MEFGWINLWGAAMVMAMLIPNIIFAVKRPKPGNGCTCKTANIAEQIGRYACMALMVLPLGVRQFGFASTLEMWFYIEGNLVLLAAYYWVWRLFFKKETRKRGVALAVLPTVMFLLCGILLRHWLLVLFALVFGAAHIYITLQSYK